MKKRWDNMVLDNYINITCVPNKDRTESDMSIVYPMNLTVAELITTLVLAKGKIWDIMDKYIKDNELHSDEDLETVYWKMEIKNLI